MRETCELVVEDVIFAKPCDRYTHTTLEHGIELGLRSVVLGKVLKEMLWSMRELQSLCLDVRVLDKDGSEIELKEDDDDDYIPSMRDEYRSSEEEFTGAGYEIDRSQAVMDEESDAEDDYYDDDENMEEDE